MKAVYRVNYIKGGLSATAFVAAPSEGEASAFLGVRDGSASVSAVASPVEIVGIDPPHAVIEGPPINRAPYESPKHVDRAEFDSLKAEIAKLQKQLAGAGVPVEK